MVANLLHRHFVKDWALYSHVMQGLRLRQHRTTYIHLYNHHCAISDDLVPPVEVPVVTYSMEYLPKESDKFDLVGM